MLIVLYILLWRGRVPLRTALRFLCYPVGYRPRQLSLLICDHTHKCHVCRSLWAAYLSVSSPWPLSLHALWGISGVWWSRGRLRRPRRRMRQDRIAFIGSLRRIPGQSRPTTQRFPNVKAELSWPIYCAIGFCFYLIKHFWRYWFALEAGIRSWRACASSSAGHAPYVPCRWYAYCARLLNWFLWFPLLIFWKYSQRKDSNFLSYSLDLQFPVLFWMLTSSILWLSVEVI